MESNRVKSVNLMR